MNISFQKTQEGTIKVVTPHNEEFIQKCKNLQGSYKNEEWTFDESMEEYVKELLIETFGVDGTSPVEFCTLIIKDLTELFTGGSVELFGRTIAFSFGGSSTVHLGQAIALIKGTITVKETRTHYEIIADYATFEIQQFPLERTKFEDIQKAIKEGWVEIKPHKRPKSKGQILTEIDFHKGKLAELEELLGKLE